MSILMIDLGYLQYLESLEKMHFFIQYTMLKLF